MVASQSNNTQVGIDLSSIAYVSSHAFHRWPKVISVGHDSSQSLSLASYGLSLSDPLYLISIAWALPRQDLETITDNSSIISLQLHYASRQPDARSFEPQHSEGA